MAPGDSTWYGRLDRRTILDAALRIAARPGATGIRVRDLGDELDADPTAIYRHFRGKSQLMAALIDRLMSDLGSTMPLEADLGDFMRAMATGALETFVRYPPIGAHLVDSRPVGPAEFALIELSLRKFEEAGLGRDTLVAHYAAFSGLLLSYVAATCRELVTAGAVSSVGMSDLPWLPTEVEITAESYPTLSSYGEQLLGMDFRAIYFAGVDVLIDSIVRMAAAAK